jgi:hypothetical protein
MILLCAWGKALRAVRGEGRGKGKVIDTPQGRRGDYQLSAQRRIVFVIGKLAFQKPTANHPRSPVVCNNRRGPGSRGETHHRDAGFVVKAEPPRQASRMLLTITTGARPGLGETTGPEVGARR